MHVHMCVHVHYLQRCSKLTPLILELHKTTAHIWIKLYIYCLHATKIFQTNPIDISYICKWADQNPCMWTYLHNIFYLSLFHYDLFFMIGQVTQLRIFYLALFFNVFSNANLWRYEPINWYLRAKSHSAIYCSKAREEYVATYLEGPY